MFLDAPGSPRELWLNEDYWPREEPRFWFIARAFNMVGRHLFPDEWTGTEGYTFVVRMLPDSQHKATSWELSIAGNIISERYPKPQSMLSELGKAPVLLGDSYPQDQWRYAQDIWRSQLQRREALMQRKRVVAEWFAAKAHDEKTLRMVAVDRRNLQPYSDPPEHWNLKWDRLDYRWTNCAYNPNEPTNPQAEPTHYIFVFREDLSRLLEQAAGLSSAATLAISNDSGLGADEANDKQAYWRANKDDIFAAAAAYIAEHGAKTHRDELVAHLLGRWSKLTANWYRTKVWPSATAGHPALRTPGNRMGESRKREKSSDRN